MVSLGVAAIALLPRAPGFSTDERRRTRIQKDAELWRSLPSSDARDALADHIATATGDLIAQRGRDRTIEQGWLYGSGWLFIGWLMMLTSFAIPNEPMWRQQLRVVVGVCGLAVALIGVLFLLAAIALVTFRAVVKLNAKWRAGRGRRSEVAAAGSGEPPAEGDSQA